MGMSGLNIITLMGALGEDPELRYTSAGKAVLNMRLATNRTWIDGQSGEEKEAAEWHTVVVWGPFAESVSKQIAKGSIVVVIGSVRTRSWEKDGEKKYTTEVVVDGPGTTVAFVPRMEKEPVRDRQGSKPASATRPAAPSGGRARGV